MKYSGGFPKLGVPIRGTNTKDSFGGLYWGPPLFRETTSYAYVYGIDRYL